MKILEINILQLHLFFSLELGRHKRRCEELTPNYHSIILFYLVLALFSMGLLRTAHGWGEQKGPPPKICHTS